MSDPFAGTRAPDTTYPDTTYPAQPEATYSGQGSPTGERSAVKQAAGQSAEAAGQAAGEVKDTAKEQAQRVGSEAKTQVRNVASEVRGKVSDQARNQNDKLVGSIRQMADHLDEMRGDRPDSPATQVVSRVADSGRQLAGYLETKGPEGVLREVEDFARRRPGAFLATALVAGFVVARLGKGVAKADELPPTTSAKPASDSFVSTPGRYDTAGYPAATTEYAATGTGTPAVVEEEYVAETARENPGGTR